MPTYPYEDDQGNAAEFEFDLCRAPAELVVDDVVYRRVLRAE